MRVLYHMSNASLNKALSSFLLELLQFLPISTAILTIPLETAASSTNELACSDHLPVVNRILTHKQAARSVNRIRSALIERVVVNHLP